MPPDLILNTVLADFTAAANGYYPQLLVYGGRLMIAVALLGCAVSWGKAGFGTSFGELSNRILISIIEIGVVYAVMENIQIWGQAIIATGTIIGNAVSGIPLTPGDFYAEGLTLVDSLNSARGWGLWLIGILNLTDLWWWLMVTGIQIIWLVASLIYLWTLIESVMLVAIAPVVICWAPVEFTWATIYAWGGRLLYITTKLLAMMLVLAVLTASAADWAAYINGLGFLLNLHFFYYLGVVLTESLVLLGLVWVLPDNIASLVRTQLGGGYSGAGQGAGEFVGYAQSGAGIAAASLTANSAGELGAYVSRKLIS